jgi:hypothetical protein
VTALEVVSVAQIDREAILRSLNLDPRNPNTQALLLVCDRYGLDPLLKHMVLIQGRPYVTRDGYLHIAHQSHQLDGIEILDEGEDKDHWWARVSVYRKDMGRPFTYKGRYPKSGGNKNYGPEMAIKCAEVAALRRAFNVTGVGAADEKWDEPDQVVELPPAEPTASKHDVDLFKACIEELEPDQRSEFMAWKADQGFGWPWSVAALHAMEAELERIVGASEASATPAAGATGSSDADDGESEGRESEPGSGSPGAPEPVPSSPVVPDDLAAFSGEPFVFGTSAEADA